MEKTNVRIGIVVKCLLFALFYFAGVVNSTLWAQQTNTFQGTVKDDTGETVIGASVILKGTSTGTVTDIDGKFHIGAANERETLVISYLGYESQ